MTFIESIRIALEDFTTNFGSRKFVVLNIEEKKVTQSTIQFVISTERPLYMHIPQSESHTQVLTDMLSQCNIPFIFDPDWNEQPIVQINCDIRKLGKVADLAGTIFIEVFGLTDQMELQFDVIDYDYTSGLPIDNTVVDKHFSYQDKIRSYYSRRKKDPGALKKTIEYCQKQIAIADKVAQAFRSENIATLESVIRNYESASTPDLKEHYRSLVVRWEKTVKDRWLPEHVGYKQLSIIYSKQGEFEEAISICQQALAQGWSGDWEARIQRYTKSM